MSTNLLHVCGLIALICGLLCAAAPGRAAPELPALPKGVAELKFSEFFITPVGPRGLELTDKLKALDGKRVRILGYMVAQEDAPRGSFLLTPIPVQLHDHDSALADDLPATTVHVSVTGKPTIGYTRDLLLLTGTLSVGNKAEPDGRVSVVRLTVEPQARLVRRNKGDGVIGSRGGASALMRRE